MQKNVISKIVSKRSHDDPQLQARDVSAEDLDDERRVDASQQKYLTAARLEVAQGVVKAYLCVQCEHVCGSRQGCMSVSGTACTAWWAVWRVCHAVVLSTLMRSKVAQQLQRRDKGPATDSLLSLVSGKWLTCGQNALPVAMGDAMVRRV
jgi:hypothetical protein